MPNEDKNIGGSLVLDLRIWWRHVKTLYKAFFHLESRPLPTPLPTLAHSKKSHLTWSIVIQNAAISLVARALRSKDLWLVQENHATVKLDSKVAFSWNENLQRKQNWIAKSTNIIENSGKLKSVFAIRATLWAKKLESCLENCRSWKTTLRKLALVVNLEAIWFEYWMKGALLTVEICVLCGWWFSNKSEIVSETPFSCDTACREL